MIRIFIMMVGGLLLSIPVLAQEDTVLSIIDMPSDNHIFEALEETNDTLYKALEQAYINNPTARGARAELLAVQERLNQAQAGYKPTVSADGDMTYTDTETDGQNFLSNDGGNLSKSASLNLAQPLYRGGRTLSEVAEAKNIIAAQAWNLSSVEQGILYEAAVAYMDVLRDEAILALNINNQELAEREKEQAENRFTVGELTRTDVSQSHARLASAEAEVITARGGLKRSKAVYKQIIGAMSTEEMAYPDTALELPFTLEEATALAESNNRTVLQAQFTKQAADDNIHIQQGDLLPEISAIGRLDQNYDPSDSIDEQRQAAVGISVSIPFYQAGLSQSRIREARKIANQRAIQIVEAKERARQEVIDAWESLETSRAEVKARQSQIEAARIAREGVHYEAELGERTTLDVLDANQELLNAQVSLITAKRNEVVAQFALARSLGTLVPQKLGFSSITS